MSLISRDVVGNGGTVPSHPVGIWSTSSS